MRNVLKLAFRMSSEIFYTCVTLHNVRTSIQNKTDSDGQI